MAVHDTRTLAAQVSQSLQDGDRSGFIRAVAGLIGARAAMTTGWKSLAQPLIDYGELGLARRVMDLYADALDRTPAAQFDRALIYTQTSRPKEALALIDALPRNVPDAAGNAYLRGTIALNLGERDTARQALLDANTVRPQSGQIWQTLSMLGSMATETAIAERILAAEKSMSRALEADRAPYLYALGKTLGDLGEVDRAYAAFAAGAVIVARQRPYDATADRTAAMRSVEGWDSATIARVQQHVGVPTDRPIILTGLPRSGSTLVEHILVSHSAVADGDELGRFSIVVNEIGGPDAAAYDRWLAGRSPNDAIRHYHHLLAQRFGKDNGRVVDKTLEASRYLGTLAALMPEAPILWMRRDPLDSAWSCFHTWFLAGLPWSWNQHALAQHFRLEDDLFARWQDILGDRLMAVDYETLVTDKEAAIPRILGHCGLAVEPQVFSPEKNPRLVTTASVTQVRAPINTRAVRSAQRYAEHLAPFIEAYGSTG